MPGCHANGHPQEVNGTGYIFTGWDGGDCTGLTDPTCTTSAKGSPTVTATFEASYYTLTVKIINGDNNDRVRITTDNAIFILPDGVKPTECSTSDYECKARIDVLDLENPISVGLQKQGDNIEWGGDCEGVPNSVNNCVVVMDQSRTVDVLFSPQDQ